MTEKEVVEFIIQYKNDQDLQKIDKEKSETETKHK